MNRPRRPLLLLAGPDSTRAHGIARRLIDDGYSVVFCFGPPGCPLLSGDACALVDRVDAVVLMPTESDNRETHAGMELCARGARHSIVVTPTHLAARGVKVHGDDAAAAAAIATILRHPSFSDARPA